jgi:hypothetical protein
MIRSKTLWLATLTVAVILLESCATSFRVIPYNGSSTEAVAVVSSGTAYVGVDLSGVNIDSRKVANSAGTLLGTSVAKALAPSFRESRQDPDIPRLEPDSSDIVVIVRPYNPKYPKFQGEISRGWARLLVLGVLGELYDIFSLDLPKYRNNVVLPVSALALVYYNAFYCYQYESMPGNYVAQYQVSILGPDGNLIRQHQFVDSANVLAQADVKADNVQIKDLMVATVESVSGTVRSFVVADSLSIRGISGEMKRLYPDDRDRVLAFKRNIYRYLDSAGPSVGNKN